MERSNFSLRLLPSLLKAAQRVADREKCSVNQLVNVALAKEVTALDAPYWQERRRKAMLNPPSDEWKGLPGVEPPRRGDEVPKGFKMPQARAKRTLKAGGA